MEHQTLDRWVIRPRDPANQRIILKIVRFLDRVWEFSCDWDRTRFPCFCIPGHLQNKNAPSFRKGFTLLCAEAQLAKEMDGCKSRCVWGTNFFLLNVDHHVCCSSSFSQTEASRNRVGTVVELVNFNLYSVVGIWLLSAYEIKTPVPERKKKKLQDFNSD